MKLLVNDQPVERSGSSAENHFSIKSSAKAFEILSSGLYSNKIRSIIRELSANAYDSHVAANKTDVPIEIGLPTSLSPIFYVKDVGIGLSHEDVMKLYTTYFESTKANSDDFIGQLGLGSKSPFSYVSNFLVESIHNGIKGVYSCFKNEQNLPSIALLSQQDTDASNGVKVTLSVNTSDVHTFVNEAKHALMYYDPQPIVTGPFEFKPHFVEHTLSGNGWKVRNTEYHAYMNGPYVVQGFIAYPILSTQLTDTDITPTAALLSEIDIDLYVPIGQVEVAASREALSYDKRTITCLVNQLENVASNLRKSFQEKIDNCSTKWEAALLFAHLKGGWSPSTFQKIFCKLHNITPFTWVGQPISNTLDLDLQHLHASNVEMMVCSLSNSKRSLKTHTFWSSGDDIAQVVRLVLVLHDSVIIEDGVCRSNELIRHWLASSPHPSARVIVIRPAKPKTQLTSAAIDAVILTLGNPSAILSSSLTKPPAVRIKSVPLKRTAGTLLRFDSLSEKRKFNTKSWVPTQVNLTEGGYFIRIDRVTPHNFADVRLSHFPEILDASYKIGMLPSGEPIYGITNKDEQLLNKSGGNWKELFGYLAEAVKSIDTISYYQAENIDLLVNRMKSRIYDKVVRNCDDLTTLICDPQSSFVEIVTKLHQFSANHTTPSFDTPWLAGFLRYTGFSTPPNVNLSEVYNLIDKWNVVLTHYPMLNHLWGSEHNSYYTLLSVPEIVDYVNLVDSNRSFVPNFVCEQ